MNNFEKQMYKILDEYGDEVKEILEDTTKEVATSCAKELKQFDGFKTHNVNYSKGWSKKKVKNGYIVHNKDHYRLTHLLEEGHLIKNQYGSFGTKRTKRIQHIGPAEKKYSEEFVQKIKRKLT